MLQAYSRYPLARNQHHIQKFHGPSSSLHSHSRVSTMSYSLSYNHHCPRLSLSKPTFQHPLLFSGHHLSKPLLLLPQNTKPLRAATTSSGTSSSTETLPKSAIQRIAEKLRSLGFVEDKTISTDESESDVASVHADSKAGEFFIPNSTQLPKYRVGHTLDPSWSTPENPVPEVGTGDAIMKFHRIRGEMAKEKEESRKDVKREKVPTLAELTLPKRELRRLRTIGIKLDKKMKIGKAGITEGIVNGIHERWRSSEVVKILVEDIFKLNMRRTHDLLERKTGGMVVWRAGSKIVLYRGVNYRYPYFKIDEASATVGSQKGLRNDGVREQCLLPGTAVAESGEPFAARRLPQSSLVHGVGSPGRVRLQLPGEKQLVEEADHLLDGLGPRFTDWWGYDPLPVDADQLPAIVPGYRRPFRLLPYGVKPKLTDDEMTIIKRLGRPLPCHFALGRNRNLQGLAAAIVKLWENCEIAKIAVKRGVQNTNSEMMAEELKRLTGGTLISRDKEFLVFYRGKDFLPSAASSAIEERRKDRMQKDAQWINYLSSENLLPAKAGDALPNNDHNVNIDSEARKMKSVAAAVKKTSTKLSVALEKKEKAEKNLADLERSCISQQIETDKEGITEEEKYMLRKVGLRMKPFLLLGRRGVFDGTIENMHLHWKYRELVKIICVGRSIDEVHQAAQTLEAESGGILVSVERARKGYAIIVYRGKNYLRPSTLRPQTLLNKKEAMRRSLEAQRRESLKLHVLKLTRHAEELKHKLVKDREAYSEWSNNLKSSSDPPDSISTPVISKDIVKSQDDSLKMIQQDSPISSLFEYNSEAAKKNGVENSSVPCDDSERKGITALYSGSHDFSSEPLESSLDASTDDQLKLATQKPSENHDHAFSALKDSATSSQDPAPSFQKVVKDQFHDDSQMARHLSNKERLLLRKQALKMKKRPVLAVGRSNAVTGVAKTIKQHFKKHPLAIINVKGRAKGTSVQEVVYKLEQATGAILVSQEPSKVILFRGWGAGHGTSTADSLKVDGDKGGGTPPSTVSPELIEAMRLECGLP